MPCGAAHVAQQRTRRDALRRRHRQRVPAEGHEDREDRVQVEPGAAGVFAGHQFEESALGQRAPQRGGRAAVLDGADRGRRALVHEDGLDGFCEHVLVSLMRSAQAEAARDHAAQDLARAAAQREGRRDLAQVGEGAVQVGVDASRVGSAATAASMAAGMACSNSVPMSLTSAASTTGLSPRASLVVTATDRLRSVASCVVKPPTSAASAAREAGLAQARDPGVEQHDARIQALGAAALEGQFGVHLHPAAALVADQRVVLEEARRRRSLRRSARRPSGRRSAAP